MKLSLFHTPLFLSFVIQHGISYSVLFSACTNTSVGNIITSSAYCHTACLVWPTLLPPPPPPTPSSSSTEKTNHFLLLTKSIRVLVYTGYSLWKDGESVLADKVCETCSFAEKATIRPNTISKSTSSFLPIQLFGILTFTSLALTRLTLILLFPVSLPSFSYLKRNYLDWVCLYLVKW